MYLSYSLISVKYFSTLTESLNTKISYVFQCRATEEFIMQNAKTNSKKRKPMVRMLIFRSLNKF